MRGGQEIERAAAGTFVGIGLELGGKDPGYVRADANLDAAVDTLMDGAMYNAGQCCCGIERIYVHESLYDAFVEKSVAWVSGLKLGNPLDAGDHPRPDGLEALRRHRARPDRRGGRRRARSRWSTRSCFPADTGDTAYLAPQILVDVDHSMRVMTEESFGPVVGIMPVKDDERGDRADERLPLRPDRQRLDRRHRQGRRDRRARSRPAPSS